MRDEEENDDDLPPKARLLKALVYALGAVLSIGGLFVVTMAVWKLAGPGNRAGGLSEPPTAPGPPAAATLALPPGAEILAMTLDGPRLAVHVRANGVEEIRIVDWRTGALVSTLSVKPGAQP